jgi:hypothetical protein
MFDFVLLSIFVGAMLFIVIVIVGIDAGKTSR